MNRFFLSTICSVLSQVGIPRKSPILTKKFVPSSNRGSRFDVGNKTSFDVIRIFVWARENVVGNKDPAAFVIAVCELSGQLLIYDRHKFESIAEDEIEVAIVETCGRVFEQIRPKVVELFEKS